VPNEYERRALLPAALIVALPGLVVWSVLPMEALTRLTDTLAIKIGGVTLLGLISIYPGMQVVRWLGVWLVQRPLYGPFGINFPTQTLLLLSDGELDRAYKRRIRDKLATRYNTTLPSQQAEANRDAALRTLQGVIRSAKREFGDDEVVSRDNIAYGFARSLVGGAALGLIASALAWWWLATRTSSHLMAHLMIVLGAVYLLILAFGWFMVRGAAHRYAISLFDTLLASA